MLRFSCQSAIRWFVSGSHLKALARKFEARADSCFWNVYNLSIHNRNFGKLSDGCRFSSLHALPSNLHTSVAINL